MAKVKPPYPYIGGKRRLLKIIKDNIPENFGNYYEPFLGAGAVALHVLQNNPDKHYYLSDYNVQIPITWEAIRDNVDEVVELLLEHSARHNQHYFTSIRNLDRHGIHLHQTLPEIAARFIYICSTSWGGGYTVTKANYCNKNFAKAGWVPDAKNIIELSKLLNDRAVHFYRRDFLDVSHQMRAGDFLYLDPPYDAVEGSAGNDNYVKRDSTHEITLQVRKLMETADLSGIYALGSNSSTANTEELWEGWHSIETQIVWTSGSAREPQTEKLWGNFALHRSITSEAPEMPPSAIPDQKTITEIQKRTRTKYEQTEKLHEDWETLNESGNSSVEELEAADSAINAKHVDEDRNTPTQN